MERMKQIALVVDQTKIESTPCLEEAVREVFGTEINGRWNILKEEAMTGQVAEKYDKIGKSARQETYKKIVTDFKNRTGCYGVNHVRTNMQVGTILDVGCGSGLLSLELAEQTNGYIFGVDLSADMINLAKMNLKQKSKDKIKQIKEFWKKLPGYCRPEDKLEKNPPFYDSVEFNHGSVYNSSSIIKNHKDINYIVCRNALHRFQDTKKAIEEMYSVLAPGGKIYIRDLKRDADWKTIVERIGERRWEVPELVEDYIGAMAAMLTKEELQHVLELSGIKNYEITDGYYSLNEEKSELGSQMREYASEVEYVCVIEKPHVDADDF